MKINLLLLLSILISLKSNAQSDTPSFILYWASKQIRFEPQQQYSSTIAFDADEFSKVILQKPSLWNGKALIPITFKIGKASFSTENFEKYREAIDAYLPQLEPIFEKGGTLTLNEISLSSSFNAKLTVQVNVAPEVATALIPLQSRVVDGKVITINEENLMLERGALGYQWGKYINNGNNQPQYMTPKQFFESVSSTPQFLQGVEYQNRKIKATISIVVKEKDVVLFPYHISNDGDYAVFLTHLHYSKVLFKPQKVVYCTWDSDDAYELALASHRIILVEDDDPRLQINAAGQHRFSLSWQGFKATRDKVFLQKIINKQGKTRYFDQPEQIIHYLTKTMTNPILMIDDKVISDWTCNIGAGENDTTAVVFSAKQGMTEAVKTKINNILSSDDLMVISTIQTPKYDLSPFEFWLFFKNKHPKDGIAPNIRTADLTVSFPDSLGSKLQIDYELFINTKIGNLSLEDESGAILWLKSEEFLKGKHTEIAEGLSLRRGRSYKVAFSIGANRVEKIFVFE